MSFFKLIKETIDHKEKWSLYHSNDNQNFHLVHSFRFLHHAKA